MTQLIDNIYAVEVPIEAKNITIDDGDLIYEYLGFYELQNVYNIESIHLINLDDTLLGTVTPDAIDFDCEPYIDMGAVLGFKNYNCKLFENTGSSYRSPIDSFRSLLTSKGLTDYSKLVIIKSK
jgi:hypothetical protein